MRNEDRCVMCGAVIPEGRQVCKACENMVLRRPAHDIQEEETNEDISIRPHNGHG